MGKIRVGVIGLGFIGVAHIEALSRLTNAEVCAVADEAGIVKSKASQLGISRYYEDYRELICDPGIDSVHICTPNHLHYTMSKEALNAGKHVICEKPLTTKREEAEELVSLAKEKGLVNAVNFNLRFYPLMHHLKSSIETGDLGRLFSINGSYLQDWLFYETDYNWRLEPEMAGVSRAVADIGSHWIDLVEFVTGLRVNEVFADFATFHKFRQKPQKPVETYSGKLLKPDDYVSIPINTEDYATVIMKMDSGARCIMTVSQVFAGRKNRLTLEIAGSRKSAAWDSERPNEIWFGLRDSANEVLLKNPSIMYPKGRAVASYPGGHNEGFPDTFKQNFKSIYDKISGKGNIDYPTFESGLREIEICDKIVESSRTKVWVKVQ